MKTRQWLREATWQRSCGVFYQVWGNQKGLDHWKWLSTREWPSRKTLDLFTVGPCSVAHWRVSEFQKQDCHHLTAWLQLNGSCPACSLRNPPKLLTVEVGPQNTSRLLAVASRRPAGVRLRWHLQAGRTSNSWHLLMSSDLDSTFRSGPLELSHSAHLPTFPNCVSYTLLTG